MLDTPGEPVGRTQKEHLYHGVYPVREQNGLICTFMGPPDRILPLLKIDSGEIPGTYHAAAPKIPIPCNWFQFNDNSPTLFHLRYLHTLATVAQCGASLGLPSESN